MHQAAIEVIEAIIGFETDSFFELCKGVVDLVEHHHAVSPIGIVLRIFVIEANGSSEVIHCLLVVSSCHEGIPSIGVIFGVS